MKNLTILPSILFLILAILSISYGLLIKAAGSGTGFFLVWIFFGVLLFLLAIAAKVHFWMVVPKLVRRILLVLLSMGVAFFIIIEGFVLSGFGSEGEKNLDYIIVLGAQVYEYGPSVALRYRLDKALKYMEENPETICVVSGGQGSNEPFPEAQGMAEYLIQNGASKERIILESLSRTTVENIRNCMEFIDKDANIGIVTNNFHVFRGLQIARKEGMTHVCGIDAGSTPLYLPNNMLREFFGEIKYLLLSWKG